VLTPPDPFTMLAVSMPLYILFEVTLIVARAMGMRSAVPPPAVPARR
jgi:Sec-independent protein secretion pathway component TatC